MGRAEPRLNDDIFVVEVDEPPKTRFAIVRDLPFHAVLGRRGWALMQDTDSAAGAWTEGPGVWFASLADTLDEVRNRAAPPLVWRRLSTGEVVDLVALQDEFDGVQL